MPRFSLNVLTINTHKGFTAFNRRFILPELREAVRSVSADIVCLQEVMGRTKFIRCISKTGRIPPTMSFWPIPCGAITPTAATPFTRKGITATRSSPAFPLNIIKISMFRSATAKARPALLPHRPAGKRHRYPFILRTPGTARSSSPGPADDAGGLGERFTRGRTGGGSR